MQRVLVFIMAVLLGVIGTYSQSSVDIYRLASETFERGFFHEADSILLHNIGNMNPEYRLASYRLLSLSALQCDRKDDAEEYARRILAENPFYATQLDEVPRFVDIIERLRGGSLQTIVTASQQAESQEETPVPVTLITEEMIKNSNARNIQELLYAYVPGIVNLEGEEMNLSMRGLASYSQENVLVMLNGVRLNSYSTNAAALDYRLSLVNIKQIEVLRGASSSLYGNVALTGVVNIITKTGAEVNGLQVAAGGGNGKTFKGSFIFGKSMMDSDIMVWGSLFKTGGYRHDIPSGDMTDGYGFNERPGYLYANRYENRPAYDFGLTFRWRNLMLQLSHNYAKKTYPYTNMHLPAMYDYDAFQVVDGITPGRGVNMTTANARYSNTWGRWAFTGDVYATYEGVGLYNVSGDNIAFPGYMYDLLTWLPGDVKNNYPLLATAGSGVYTGQNWLDYNVGATAKCKLDYQLSRLGKGNLLFGLQYDYFNLFYNDFSVGHNYGEIIFKEMNNQEGVLSNHHESNMSVFLQLKHFITPKLVLNGGLRFDMKNRYNDDNQKVISPRLALIWSPKATMNFKLAYARSFVDAPYFYRTSRHLYFGTDDLNPEFLNNVQMNAIFSFPTVHMRYETNLFYNSAKDVILLGEAFYENSGTLKSLGWENIVTYEHRGWRIQGNLFMQRFFDVDGISGTGHNKYNVPNITGRLNVAKRLFNDKLTLMANMSVNSSNTVLLQPYVLCNGKPLSDTGLNVEQPAYFLADMGARYSLGNVDFDVKMKNITNQHYRLGGDRVPVLQEGFMVLGTLTWNIR